MSMAAWLGALTIGLILGLLGAGGSIVTVPVLLYVVDQPDKIAIAGSLAIVGGIAFVGGVIAAINKRVHARSVVLFGVPGIAATYGGAWLASFVSGATQLVVFAVVMVLAAMFMLRRRAVETPASTGHMNSALSLGAQGSAVGVLTGFVGVGGGFLIVPALVLLARLPMPVAVGTSLCIIALNSFAGFWKYRQVLGDAGMRLDSFVIGSFIIVGAIGSLGGSLISGRIPQTQLQRAFALFLVAMGGFILWQNLHRVL